MHEMMVAMLVWIGAHTDYRTDRELPNLVLTTPHNLCARYGIAQKSRCDGQRLRGFYDKDLTIYLGTDFDAARPEHQSWLLHELVHYVQWANGEEAATCLGHLELEAYDLQDAWRVDRGLAPSLAEFNRIFLAASCDA